MAKKRETSRPVGAKWKTLEHRGPLFSPAYKRLPSNVTFGYAGRVIKLSKSAEEIAGFYARMLGHEYLKKSTFRDNFLTDWRASMTAKERNVIQDLKKCDFRRISAFFLKQKEARKNMSEREKSKARRLKKKEAEEYGVCLVDERKEQVGNFRVEPPGLFMGRGKHPLMGRVKQRVVPEDVIVNCSPRTTPSPPKGRQWKGVLHDKTVTWLSCWNEKLLKTKKKKYIWLNPASRLRGECDKDKYEKARELGHHIEEIREEYKNDWKSKDIEVRQRGVALYLIDKLALRAGNEKGGDQADTVGCCTLRVEHLTLKKQKRNCVVTFDFLGKDSIRYFKEVRVEKLVWESLKVFVKGYERKDKIFDTLSTSKLNDHLNELMDGLTAKVFRTYNSSLKLEKLLEKTPEEGSIEEKVSAFNKANREVAILCNHRKTVPKNFKESIEKLDVRIKAKRSEKLKKQRELSRCEKGSSQYFKAKAQLDRKQEQLKKLEVTKKDRVEGKAIALQTSKTNYIDPRIVVAWCMFHKVPIEKIYNKTLRAKFKWAIDSPDEDFQFEV